MRTGDEIREIFRLKYSNIDSGQAPGISDFELSLLLTDAQKQIVDEYYSGAYARRQPLEDVERVRKNLSILIRERNFDNSYFVNTDDTIYGYNTVSIPVRTSDYYLWRIQHEECEITVPEKDCKPDKGYIRVKPVRHDELDKVLRNPFKSPDVYVLRLDVGNRHQLISNYTIKNYTVRYVEFPPPFIIAPLGGFVSTTVPANINNVSEYERPWETVDGQREPYGFLREYISESWLVTRDGVPCIFDNFVEDIIINRAVELAILGYKENSLQMQMGMDSKEE